MYKRKHEHSINNKSTDVIPLTKSKNLYQKFDYYPYHCGAFALYNLLLNYGKHIGLNKLIKLCNPDPLSGTNNEQMDKTIEYLNRKFDINIQSIEANIFNIKTI